MSSLTTLDEKTIDAMRDGLEKYSETYPSMMDLSMLDGFLTGLALMPTPPALEEVKDEIFAPAEDQGLPEDAELDSLIQDRLTKIVACLQAGHGFEPIVFPLLDDNDEMIIKGEGAALAITPWALGFYTAMMHWEDDVEDDDVAGILCFLTPECFESEEADGDEESKELYHELTAMLQAYQTLHPVPEMLDVALYDVVKTTYGLKKLLNPNKPIMKAVKVGRNDPCPCGSGKKFKQCCAK